MHFTQKFDDPGLVRVHTTHYCQPSKEASLVAGDTVGLSGVGESSENVCEGLAGVLAALTMITVRCARF